MKRLRMPCFFTVYRETDRGLVFFASIYGKQSIDSVCKIPSRSHEQDFGFDVVNSHHDHLVGRECLDAQMGDDMEAAGFQNQFYRPFLQSNHIGIRLVIVHGHVLILSSTAPPFDVRGGRMEEVDGAKEAREEGHCRSWTTKKARSKVKER